jgi:thiamine biosynthesis lipoprotein
MPSTGTLASWVIAQDAMVADGFATALLVIEPELLASRDDLSFVTMTDNGRVTMSPNFPGEVFG